MVRKFVISSAGPVRARHRIVLFVNSDWALSAISTATGGLGRIVRVACSAGFGVFLPMRLQGRAMRTCSGKAL